MNWPDKPLKILLSEEAIQNRVQELASRLSEDYRGKVPLLVCVLRGAAIFHADLIRAIDTDLRIDFISVSSYGAATETSGEVRLTKDLETSIKGMEVVLVEDIVDTGLTLRYLLRSLRGRSPASLAVCALLSKPSRRKVEVTIDYLGFEIPDEFAVGYGLDYGERYRNLPYVASLG